MFPAAPRPTLSENKWNYVSYASLMLNCFLVRYWYINTGILDTDRKHDNLNGWNSVFKIRERSTFVAAGIRKSTNKFMLPCVVKQFINSFLSAVLHYIYVTT